MIELEDKVTLITGAVGGIGQEMVELLLDHKSKVALVDLDIHKGREVLAKLSESYGTDRILFIQADVTNKKELEDAFKKTVAHFKHLDIVINNAGIIDELDPVKTASVNMIGVMIGTSLAMEHYLPKYKQGEEGVVLNTASMAGLVPFFGAPSYCASKFALVGYGRALGHPVHYQQTKVRVLTLCPGFTETKMIDPPSEEELENSDRFTKMMLNTLEVVPTQKVEEVGKMFLRTLFEGKTGSVWMISNGQGGEVEFPSYTVKT